MISPDHTKVRTEAFDGHLSVTAQRGRFHQKLE